MHGTFLNDCLLDPWPRESGPRRITCGGGALYSARAPDAQEFVPAGHWFLLVLTGSRSVTLTLGEERPRTIHALPGMLAITPAGTQGKASWEANLENILVSIAPCKMREMAEQEFGSADVEISPTYLTIDHSAYQLGKLIKAELTEPDHANELYLDSLITLFGIHVLRNYSNLGHPRRRPRALLSNSAATRISDYLQENFRRKLTIAQLAEVCGLSPGHFAEAFTQTFGVPPHSYVIEQRLEFARRLLTETEISIPEVAYLSGFSSQSHLTKLMKTRWGVTPYQVRTG